MSILYGDLPLTDFPNSLDVFAQMLNITATDGKIVQQYMDAMNAGDQALANQIIATLPSATQKIINADGLNKITQAMLAVERFYYTDIEPYIDDLQADWLDVINQFYYAGTWATGSAYEKNNIVSYDVGGVIFLYMATVDNVPVGAIPTNTNYWRQLTIQGIQGVSGVGLSYRQEWNAIDTFYVEDAVTYDGALWQCLEENAGVQPGTDSTKWKRIMSLAATTYPIQDTEPTAQDPGELWFNTSNNVTEYIHVEPLSTPATAANIQSGYQAYDADGNVIVGTLTV